MTDFVSEMESRYVRPSDAEVARLIAEAHRMRSQAILDTLTGFGAMLRRNIVRKPSPAQAHPA